ncbi:MAG TPA: glycoside hydrolase family 15 protein [Chloroflexota bacterium]|nr:glycoside hydrolase family 15 protein [Chloroflexota bacterium]
MGRQENNTLRTRSLEIIRSGQAESGAYVACPTYPTYHYSWFRDGAFIAAAADDWGDHCGAACFYRWATGLITARGDAVGRCLRAAARGERPEPGDLLHTRYGLDGQPGSEDWPNFQLDGFGTLLWGIEHHLRARPGSHGEIAAAWTPAVRLLVRYLAALWREPNHDCWEEFPDRVAVSTLAAIHAGLRAAYTLVGAADPDGALASEAADQIREWVLSRGTIDDHLIKQIDGEDVVDASLLWASTPFGEHGLLSPRDPLMLGTARRIERDLVAGDGGVYRYRADTYYGGGEWVLLTALLGQYYARAGNHVGAARFLEVVECQADPRGQLPEQWSTAVLAPSYVQEWTARWGPVATPLLWSHAEYLRLRAALNEGVPPD